MNDVLDSLLSLAETNFGSTFKGYFKGRQKVPALSDLPLFIAYPIRTTQKNSGTLRDVVHYEIGVEILINLRSYFDSTNGQGDQLDTLDALMDLVEGRDSEGVARDDTVIGIIRQNITIGGKVLFNNEVQVEYEDYSEKYESQTASVNITFTAEDRPNRLNS